LLVKEYGEEVIASQLDASSKEILAEYIRHGLAVRKERERAAQQNQLPNFIKLAREWGGVTIAYRRSMQESPAYVNNHEELIKALQEGIYYAEGLEPAAVDLNEYGHSEALICHKRILNQENEWVTTKEEVRLPARSILVATGTQPNTAYEFEHRGTFNRLNMQYQHYEDHDGELAVAHGVEHCKDPQFGPFTSYHKGHRRVSLIGDTHPVFHGNVVKAIASGLRTYPKIVDILQPLLGKHGDEAEYQTFAKKMDALFKAQVIAISRKTANIIELTIQAPQAAKHFKPGQFYRLQNFETFAPHIDHTLIQMEPLALVTAECNPTLGTLTFIVMEGSATAKLCATLKPGEPVSLMGPTGVRTKIPTEHETVLIIGNQSSFAFIRNLGPALRAAGNKVVFLAQLNNKEEAYCQSTLEQATDIILWQTKTGDMIEPSRPTDMAVSNSDIITSLSEHAHGMALTDVDRVFLFGDTDMLRLFQAARKTALKNLLIKNPPVIGSVYGNMQCMLKGVCAQCLQWQIDPETGLRTKAVFACSWQDQPLEIIDIDHIDARQIQNRLLDQLSRLWVDHLFRTFDVPRI
jgi:NAD(P)H-flavin reductase